MTSHAWDAVILAGGRASRLGGVSKPQLRFQGMTLLERALSASSAARSRVVVGDDRDYAASTVLHVREYPRWSGPAAAIAAGLSVLPDDDVDIVVVLAADLPHVVTAVPLVTAHLDSASHPDGVWDGWIATDEGAQPQPLLAAYRRTALERRCESLRSGGALSGASLRALLEGLRLQPLLMPTRLCRDIDTPADASEFAIAVPADWRNQ